MEYSWIKLYVAVLGDWCVEAFDSEPTRYWGSFNHGGLAGDSVASNVGLLEMFRTYVYRNADMVLDGKNLLREVFEISNTITKIDHKAIKDSFLARGWTVENSVLPESRWGWDAYKDKVVVSIEFSLIDAAHRDFLRVMLWKHMNMVDAMVYVTSISRAPKFEEVKREIETFEPILDIPILLIGLDV